MYAKVFSQIYDSSIAEDWIVRFVFMDLLVLADCDGVVDITHEAIARRTNVPLEHVKRAISELEKEDDRSRTEDEKGARIRRLDDHRDWGWWIVNYEKFRNIFDEDKRRSLTRDRMRKLREKRKNESVTLGDAGDKNVAESDDKQKTEDRRQKDIPSVPLPLKKPVQAERVRGVQGGESNASAVLENESEEAIAPTWEAVKEEAAVRGVKFELAKKFFEHYEDNNLWMNQFGKPIKWRNKLKTWQEGERVTKGNSRPSELDDIATQDVKEALGAARAQRKRLQRMKEQP